MVVSSPWLAVTPRDVLVDLRGKGARTISPIVRSAVLDVAPLSAEQVDAWNAKAAGEALSPSDVCIFGDCEASLMPAGAHEQLLAWVWSHGIACARVAPVAIACIGARFHHDADSYPSQGFCVMWLSCGLDWELYFPFAQQRVALTYGTVILFDSAQPHAVVRKGATSYDEDDFAQEPTGFFVSQDFQLTAAARRAMGVSKVARRGQRGLVRIGSDAAPSVEDLDELSGAWHCRVQASRGNS